MVVVTTNGLTTVEVEQLTVVGDGATEQSRVPSQVGDREEMIPTGDGGWWLLLGWSVGGVSYVAALLLKLFKLSMGIRELGIWQFGLGTWVSRLLVLSPEPFASHLRKYDDVFIYSGNNGGRFGSHVKLNSKLKTADERTRVVGEVIKCLAEEELIPDIQNELYPVASTFGSPIFFSLDRAAAPYFGIKAYAVPLNGYVEKDGQKFLWIGKRSQVKSTYPGMLDILAGGGLPHGIACGENIIKECQEEAGIPRSISNRARPVGAVSYTDINGFSYKRDVIFCYDLKLPEDFVPMNQDGEVESFQLMPVAHVANVIRRTEFFKPNCSLAIIDFLFRHGYIRPEYFGYLDLLQSLRRGDFS
ncbi:Nudix hydrolase 20 [Citrus sinensis]|uniref:Nudix hydrolase 20 n=1 Tax=Citrus sinensis TaxID=2711 RepID=A0ACB8NQQ7_CITSI|nr:Nudix hydrolase 20 [Citrus sinensis]